MVGTSRNVERSGRRHVTRTSSIARSIEDVRHVDIDLCQYCPKCKRPEAYVEVKRMLVSDHEWDQVRRHADLCGHKCLALLVVEWDDSLGVKYFDSENGQIYGPKWGGDEVLIKVFELARDRHACW
jgi:hypothetical protein